MKYHIKKKVENTISKKDERKSYLHLDDRRLSIIVFSLFFSWTLAFPFQGQILYSLTEQFNLSPEKMIFSAVTAHFIGLFLCGFFIKSIKDAKQLMIGSIIFCIFASCIFFFPPSSIWLVAIILSSFLSGSCVGAWGFFSKMERLKMSV